MPKFCDRLETLIQATNNKMEQKFELVMDALSLSLEQ